jgi:hypothetical protein
MSNLCSGSESGLKNKFIDKNKFKIFIDSLYIMVFEVKTKNRMFLDLKKNCFGLLTNLLTNVEHRKYFI